MLYLIRTFGRNGRSKLKIGYTSNLSSRLDNYYHSNPFFEFLGSRKGELEEEKKMHMYLTLLGYKYEKLNEWFQDTQEVIIGFHESISEIDKLLWRRRDEVWNISDLKSGRGIDKRLREIFDDLYIKNYNPKKTKFSNIEKDYMYLRSQEKLKEMRNSDFPDIII